jgi:3-methylcrotonyl-CoA carboxylase alpha subunit
MQQVLRQFAIGGVKTNIPFLQAICHQPKFIAAALSTNFLEKESIETVYPDKNISLLLAITYDYLECTASAPDSLLQDAFAWSMQGTNSWCWRYQDEDVILVRVTPVSKNECLVHFGQNEHQIKGFLDGHLLRMEYLDKSYQAFFNNDKEQINLYLPEGQQSIQRYFWNKSDAHAAHKGQLTAPMPSTIVAILKNIGEPVKAGERLIVLEAMKMEHTIHAPADGILSDIFYGVGEQVNEGAELLALSEPDS